MFCFFPTAFPPKNLDIQFLLDRKSGAREKVMVSCFGVCIFYDTCPELSRIVSLSFVLSWLPLSSPLSTLFLDHSFHSLSVSGRHWDLWTRRHVSILLSVNWATQRVMLGKKCPNLGDDGNNLASQKNTSSWAQPYRFWLSGCGIRGSLIFFFFFFLPKFCSLCLQLARVLESWLKYL